MSALYSAGYNGDKLAAMGQQLLGRRDEQPQAVPNEVSPYAKQAQRMSAPGQSRAPGQGNQNLRRRAGQATQQTFRQMQAQGQARPAPPPPEPAPQAQAVPDQRQQAMQSAQQALGQPAVSPAQQQAVNMRRQMGAQPVLQQAPEQMQASLQQAQQAYAQPPQQQMQMAQAPAPAPAPQQLAAYEPDPMQYQMAQQQQMQAMQQAYSARTPETDALMRQAQQMGLDPNAAMMDPQGFQRYLAEMQGQQTAMASQPPIWQSGGDMPEAQSVPPQVAPYAQAPMAQNPVLQMAPQTTAAPMGQMPMETQAMGQGFAAPVLQQAPAPTPAAAPSTGAPAVGTMPRFTGDINAYIGEALNNPGGYSFDETRKLYERLGQNIDDDFSQQERSLRNEMAARGLSDSSIYGGRMQDLNVGRRQARQDLLQTLGSQQAQALFGQQTGFLDRLLGVRGQDQTAAYQQGQLGISQAELNRGLMNDQDRLMLALLGVGDF